MFLPDIDSPPDAYKILCKTIQFFKFYTLYFKIFIIKCINGLDYIVIHMIILH